MMEDVKLKISLKSAFRKEDFYSCFESNRLAIILRR